MEFPVQLSRVKVLDEVFKFPGNLYIFVIREEIHVSEAINCDEGQVFLTFSEVM